MVESIITNVLEVVKCLAPLTESQFSYLRNYTSNIENLKKEIEEMKNQKTSNQHAVDQAKRNGEDIEKSVEMWLESVNNVIDEAEKFVGVHEATANKRCFSGLCPNLKARLQHSKEAVRQLEAISKLRETGRFDRISYPPIPEDIGLLPSKDYEAIESRVSTLKDILGALNDPNVNMLGIYGMGGIGKTTLAKEVARQAESDKLFDQVVFAEVSHSQDIRKIQGEIADKLGVKLKEETDSGRARRLCNRLKKEKKILLILDNIWEKLDLQAVGIPYGNDHKGCKILLTTRSENALSRKMDSQRNFLVGVLDDEEAWRLFKKIAGDYIEGSEFKSIAMGVMKECAGLPISIVTVATALRNKRLFDWKDALEQLRRPSSKNFKDIQPDAYSAIKLSYNKLEGEELKEIFLLIGYTYISSCRELLLYGMGLGLFQGIEKMEEAQARVHTLVHKLKASCMLLDHTNKVEEQYSMHDVVRDVAIAIASTEHNVLTMTNGELANQWESLDEGRTKLYTSIVLHDLKTNVLPEKLNCPQLKLLHIEAAKVLSSLTIPENFFTGMIQVRVLVLIKMNLLSFPISLGFLTNLRTLYLNCCNLQDIATIGNLVKLEILCIKYCAIRKLPVEIGQLTQLKLLDLRSCPNLKVISPNVLSRLCRLEELYLPFSLNKWEEEVEGLKNASLDELEHLLHLTSLELQTKDVNTLPRGLFFEKLERYKICVGNERHWDYIGVTWHLPRSTRTFVLELNSNICLKDGLIVQLKGVESLLLSGLQEQDIKNFVSEFVKVGSLQLKHLRLEGCHAPNTRESQKREESTINIRSNEIIFEDYSLFNEKVVLSNLESLFLHSIYAERIWQSQHAAMCYGIQNLTRLSVYECRNLRCLFPSSIVSSFVRLQRLKIHKCSILEEMIDVDQAEMKNIIFPQLQFLEMIDLEKLTCFSTENVLIEFPSLKGLHIKKCHEFMAKYKSFNHDSKKKVSLFHNLEYLTIEAKHMPWIYRFIEDFLSKLKFLHVELDESTTISSVDYFFRRFHTMKNLLVIGRIDSEEMVEMEERERLSEYGMTTIISEVNEFCDVRHIWKHSAILDNLENLEIVELEFDNLINLVPSSTTFQNLTSLQVEECKGFIKLLTSSTAKSLVQLRVMTVRSCSTITEIVADNEGNNTIKDEIVFRELKFLELSKLNSLTSFCSGNCTFKFPSLEELMVTDCPTMKIFSGGELITPNLYEVLLYEAYEYNWIWERDLNTTIEQLYFKKKKEDKEATKGNQEENEAEGSEIQRL